MTLNKSTSAILGASAAMLLAIGLSGCSVTFIDQGDDDHGSMHDQMMGDQSGEFSGQDLMFAQMMIPHHQQAVEMGTLAESRALSPQVLELALQIKEEQSPEIQLMTSWLEKAGVSPNATHDMPMGGMLSQAEFDELSASSGEEFDKLFLEGMIKHHQGAIEMAQMILNSENEEVRALGQGIVESQSQQIEYMQELLQNY